MSNKSFFIYRFALYVKSFNPDVVDSVIEKGFLALSRGDPNKLPGNILIYQTFLEYELIPSFYTNALKLESPFQITLF